MSGHLEKLRLVEARPVAATPGSGPAVPRLRPHPKGHIPRRTLRWLLVIGVLPFVTIIIRTTALPGMVNAGGEVPGLDAIRRLGSALNETFSLSSVPPGQRHHVLYLLLVPSYAMLIALARLTLGIRVLGFRSILIAVGFHQVGILPSLFLIAVVVATVSLVRPWLKRVRLPYYARISVILSLVAITMVSALLASPWVRSEALWGVAYFPVIVLGMVAEGIVNTLNRDSPLSAWWRASTTIILAVLMFSLTKVSAVLETVLQFPEVLLTEVIGIILIAEFLDFRLLQDWDAKMAGMAAPDLLSNQPAYRVAVVRNSVSAITIGRLGRPAPSRLARRSVQRIVNALRAAGHTVKVLEGDLSLLSELNQFVPSHPRTGRPGGIVLNLAHGIQGNGRYTHVPAMLEMAGVAYAGPTPNGHAAIFDKLMTKTLLQQVGVPTPGFRLMARSRDDAEGLAYPLIVKPRHEWRYGWYIVRDAQQFKDIVKTVRRKYRQEVLVEEFIAGRQIMVALLGNGPIECLPLVEFDPTSKKKTCPARIDEALAERIRAYARTSFRTCGCRDYARIDFRVSEVGQAYVIEINTIGILDENGSFAKAGTRAGYTFSQLLNHIIEVARARYLVDYGVQPIGPQSGSDAPRHSAPLRGPSRRSKNGRTRTTKHPTDSMAQ